MNLDEYMFYQTFYLHLPLFEYFNVISNYVCMLFKNSGNHLDTTVKYVFIKAMI